MDGARNPQTPYVRPPPAPKPPGTKPSGPPKTKQTDASKLSALLGMFPSTTVTPKDLSGIRQSSRQQVLRDYSSTPLPSLQSYLQPFVDASQRISANGQNYYNYLSGATDYAKGLQGAFGDTATAATAAAGQTAQAMGGSGHGVVDPAASTIPVMAVGSNFVNYLNALKPVAGATVQESQRALNAEEGKAQGTYEQAAGQRRQDIQTAIDKLYGENVNSLQSQRNADHKDAITEYALTGTTSYRAAQLKLARERLQQSGDKADAAAGLADKRYALEQRRVNAQIKKWQSASTAKGIKIPASVLKLLQGSTRPKLDYTEYTVQPIVTSDNQAAIGAGYAPGADFGKQYVIRRGPNQGPPAASPKYRLVSPTGKPKWDASRKVYVPLTGAQWDTAATQLGISTGKGPAWAKQYLATYLPRPQGS